MTNSIATKGSNLETKNHFVFLTTVKIFSKFFVPINKLINKTFDLFIFFLTIWRSVFFKTSLIAAYRFIRNINCFMSIWVTFVEFKWFFTGLASRVFSSSCLTMVMTIVSFIDSWLRLLLLLLLLKLVWRLVWRTWRR